MKKLEQLMEKKKGGKEIDPVYKDAKMSMLKMLRDEMTGMMRDDLSKPGVKEVKVASNNPEDLAAGLDKAKEMIADHSDEDMPEHDEDMEDDDSMQMGREPGMLGEDEEMEKEPGAELIADQIEHEGSEGELSDEEIQQLEMLLEKVKKSKKVMM